MNIVISGRAAAQAGVPALPLTLLNQRSLPLLWGHAPHCGGQGGPRGRGASPAQERSGRDRAE